ncbi:glyoxylate/hydroxypyruvate reductase A [Nguyenibacter vanlangensis]|uniref:Glyoxylate/hydroxypyruvate reductase A n=2 Tax=Nguyenibacter vanlangensis TaxID=1216886 RepID=A0ABZ3CZX9_9PROT
MSFVFKSTDARRIVWQPRFAAELPDLPFHAWPETGPAEDVRYLAAWQVPDGIGALLPNLEVLFSVGAGIDQLNLASVPGQVKVVRMVEPGLVDGMIEYVLWAVLSCHRDMFSYARRQRQHVWSGAPNRAAGRIGVGVMGAGALGGPVLRALAARGYACRSWSRTPRPLDGVAGFAGAAELDDFLAGADILVCLMPLTEQTRGILNRDLFARLPRGACLINCGRGGHLVQADLLEALADGQVAQAVLDVTEPEPLPAGHPFWDHPRVMLTPHIASSSQAESGVDMVIANIRRHRNGERMVGEIDRAAGY